MNQKRRKQIAALVDQTRTLMEAIEAVKEEEDEYRENMPENMQDGEKYQAYDDASNNLEYAQDNMDDAITNLEEAAEL